MGTPTAVKTAAVLSPNEVRAMAYGFLNAATNVGAIVTPLVVPLVALQIGWANAFLLTGGLGFAWVVAWFALRAHLAEAVHPAETATAAARLRITEVLADRGTWAVAGARVLSDNIWWLLLYWMPDLFHRVFHLPMQAYGPPLALIYAASGAGAVLAGLASNRLLAAGVSLNATRKWLLFAGAVLVTPVWFAPWASSYWIAAAILGLTLAGHQVFSVNVFALASDVTAPGRVATVVAIAAFCGNISGMVMLQVAGWTLDKGYGYAPLLGWASVSYLLGVGWVQLLLPRVRAATARAEEAKLAAARA
jgi:ACS family hexuronate transporter-like MFS transporter